MLQASDGGEVQVSARELDSQLLWKRMEQMAQISTEGHENFTVIIAGANNGGLVSHLGGLPIFVPVSQLERKPDKTWWTVEVRWGTFPYLSWVNKEPFR